MKKFLWALLFAAAALCIVFPLPARAADLQIELPTTRFFCFEEVDANAIADKLKDSDDEGDKVAKPLIAEGKCILLPVEVVVNATYHGMKFKGPHANMEVVGFPNQGEHKVLYAIMDLDAQKEDSI